MSKNTAKKYAKLFIKMTKCDLCAVSVLKTVKCFLTIALAINAVMSVLMFCKAK